MSSTPFFDRRNPSRRFMIHGNWGGCGRDAGWFMMMDSAAPPITWCLWSDAIDWPMFIYSKRSTKVAWGKTNNIGMYK